MLQTKIEIDFQISDGRVSILCDKNESFCSIFIFQIWFVFVSVVSTRYVIRNLGALAGIQIQIQNSFYIAKSNLIKILKFYKKLMNVNFWLRSSTRPFLASTHQITRAHSEHCLKKSMMDHDGVFAQHYIKQNPSIFQN